MKAILVMEMPEDCRSCPCGNIYSEMCDYYGKEIEGEWIPSWCPIVPMPEQKEGTDRFAEGFNACLDKIDIIG